MREHISAIAGCCIKTEVSAASSAQSVAASNPSNGFVETLHVWGFAAEEVVEELDDTRGIAVRRVHAHEPVSPAAPLRMS